MKDLLAMFFSFVLIASQAMSITEVRDVGVHKAALPACCGHCGSSCQERPCCTANEDSNSQRPAPAVPSRGVTRNDLQLSAAVVIQLLSSTAPESVAPVSSFSVPLSLAAPLYQRNCSFLI